MEKKREKFITFNNKNLKKEKEWKVKPISNNIDVENNLRYNKYVDENFEIKNKKINAKDTFNFDYKVNSMYKANTDVGNKGKGDGDININNNMWYPKSSRDSNKEFRKNIESFSFNRFQYLDINPQKIGNKDDHLKRVGENTRKSKKEIKVDMNTRKFNY